MRQAVGEVVGILVGNDLRPNTIGVYWMGRSGRAPSAAEMAATRAPFNSESSYTRATSEPADDELSDEQALEACKREQERAPADLIGV